MQTTIHLSDDEVAQLKDFTSQSDPAAAVRAAMLEYIRYVKRMRLKELSGRVEVEDNWRELEAAELGEARLDQNGSRPD